MAPAAPGSDLAVLTAKVQRLAKLRSLPLRTDTPEILAILEALAEAPVTVEALRATRAGVEVNDRFLRQHEHEGVRTRSTELVARWRALAAAERAKLAPTSPSPSEPPAAAAPAAPAEAGSARMDTDEAPSSAEPLSQDTPSVTDEAPASPADSAAAQRAGPPAGVEISASEFLARCRNLLQQQAQKAAKRKAGSKDAAAKGKDGHSLRGRAPAKDARRPSQRRGTHFQTLEVRPVQRTVDKRAAAAQKAKQAR